jgi:folate-binding protein YgfZ
MSGEPLAAGETEHASPPVEPLPSASNRAGLEAQYRALREGCAVTRLSERGVLAVEGPERQGFLHRMLSHDVQALTAGAGCKAALLDPKGHIQALLRVLVTPSSVLLETAADRIGPVEAILNHYKVGTPVRFRPIPIAVLGLLGPEAPAILRRVGADSSFLGAESHAELTIADEPVRISRSTDLPGGGFCVHSSPEGASAVFQALVSAGAAEVGRPALDLLRIERGRPWFGPDVTAENLLHETGLIQEYHSSAKGCYVGQEVVARLEARGGHVNKLLRGLKLEAPVASGTRLLADGHDAGWVTTAELSPRLGPVALAFVKRPWMEPGTRVHASSHAAQVLALPFEDS